MLESLEPRLLLSGATDVVVDGPSLPDVTPQATAVIEASLVAGSEADTTLFEAGNQLISSDVMMTEEDFERIRAMIRAGEDPWLTTWNWLQGDGYSQLGSDPRPLETVVRGGTGQNFNQMVIDIQRTYQLALRWQISGDTAYADEAVRYLNAWSSTNTELTGNSDRFLASGLYGFDWVQAADIMKGYSGWAAEDVEQFENYLIDVYYPMQSDFLTNHNGARITNYWANWDLANIQGMMAIGIFTGRQDIYDEAVDYLFDGGGNGALDKAFYYLHPGNLMQWQESGRDQGHTILGMALFGHIAQMGWNQGLDLYAHNNYQFLAAAEYIAKYNLGYDVPFETYVWGKGQGTLGAWPYDIQSELGSGSRGHSGTAYALIVSHYVQRLGMDAPYSLQRVAELGYEGRNNGDDMGWGTLTYYREGITDVQPPRGLTATESGRGHIRLDWFGGANADTYNIYRSTSEDGAYSLIASGISDLLTYTDHDLPEGVYFYRVTAVADGTETVASNTVNATSATQLHTYLQFDENAGDSAADASGNGYDATLNHGAGWSDGRFGRAVSLDGRNDYISLPEGIVEDLEDFTISTWVYLDSQQNWARIFDFGDDRGRWMYLTPSNGNAIEFATTTVYGYNQQTITGTAPLPTNQWVHVAVTLSEKVGRLYVNGELVGSNTGMDFPPAQIQSTPENWIGRSHFASDPYLDGRIDDFRIYAGALTPEEVVGLINPSVPASPTDLTATPGGDRIILNWSPVSGATGYTVRRSPVGSEHDTTIATNLTAPTYTDTDVTVGVTYAYVITATNTSGSSPDSVEVFSKPEQDIVVGPGETLDGDGSIPGNLTISGGTLLVDVQGLAPDLSASLMTVAGYATLSDGAVLDLTTTETSAMGLYASATLLSAGTLSGTFGSIRGVAIGNVSGYNAGIAVTYTNSQVHATVAILRDANLDGSVDLLDLSQLAVAFRKSGTWASGDFNGDGEVDLLDLSLLATNFGAEMPVAAAPEEVRVMTLEEEPKPAQSAVSSLTQSPQRQQQQRHFSGPTLRPRQRMDGIGSDEEGSFAVTDRLAPTYSTTQVRQGSDS